MNDATTVVRIENVSKRFVIRKEKSLKERLVNFGRSNLHKDDFWALRDINIEIDSGSTIGLIGPNGSGKSTLLKLIGGIVQPTAGSVTRRGRLAALLELGTGFHPDLTGRENVFLNASILGLTRKQTEKYFDAIVDFSGIEQFIDTQVKFYSSGMYVRLAFAVAVHVDPDLLLVDEVLAVGDEPFQRKCMDRIRSFQSEGRTIILVSHALDQVAEVCDRAVVLEHGIVVADGEPRDALRHLRADFEEVRNAERARERVSGERTATTSARIAAVRVTDADGRSRAVLNSGSTVCVEIDVEADTSLANGIVGFSLENSSGQGVYGTNSKLLGIALPTFQGLQTFTFRVNDFFLGEGQISVIAAVAEGSGVEIDRKVDAATFSVQTDGTTLGIVYAKSELTVG
ncbi:ABC transporter ATP-binding protein [Jatrophihabitans sp. DSM 45814]